MDPHDHILRALHLTLDQRNVMLAVEEGPVAHGDEVAKPRRQPCGDHALDQLLGAAPVGHEVGHRDHLQPVASAVLGQVGHPRHRAVVVHDLADHTGRDQPGQSRQVDGRLGLPDSLERPPRPGLEREHVTRLHELTRAGLGVDGDLNGAGPIRRGNTGADSRTRLDRDGKGRLERGLVLGRHQVETELVAALGRQRQADQAAALLGHEVDRLRSDELGGHRQIALVLPILVIAYHHHLALADVLDCLFNRGKRAAHRSHCAPPGISRSTYFASTSTSKLTVIPGSARPRFVRSSVSGISDTVND